MRDEDVPDSDADNEEDPISGWVLAASVGDARAWDQLVKRFAGLVWAICRAHRLSADDAADVSQLTWLRLLENLDRIRDPQRLAGWLATTWWIRRARPVMSTNPVRDGSLMEMTSRLRPSTES